MNCVPASGCCAFSFWNPFSGLNQKAVLKTPWNFGIFLRQALQQTRFEPVCSCGGRKITKEIQETARSPAPSDGWVRFCPQAANRLELLIVTDLWTVARRIYVTINYFISDKAKRQPKSRLHLRALWVWLTQCQARSKSENSMTDVLCKRRGPGISCSFPATLGNTHQTPFTRHYLHLPSQDKSWESVELASSSEVSAAFKSKPCYSACLWKVFFKIFEEEVTEYNDGLSKGSSL